MRKNKIFLLIIVGILLFTLIGCGTTQSAPASTASGTPGNNAASSTQAAKDFFKGKTMTIIVPYSVGGGFDKVARIIAPGLEKELGVTAVVKNTPGAGGLLGANDINNAKPDGLTIGILNVPGMIYNKLLEDPNAKFDLNTMSWIGRGTAEARIIAVNKNSTLTSVDSFIKAGRPIKLSITGKGSDDYFASILVAKAFGYQINTITGYDGSQEAILGAERGEVDGTQNTTSTMMPAIKAGELKPVMQLGLVKDPQVNDVPLASDVVKSDGKDLLNVVNSIIALDRSFAGPPGIPQDRLELLSQTLIKVMNDQDTKDKATKSMIPLAPLSSADTTKLVKDVFGKAGVAKQLVKDSMK